MKELKRRLARITRPARRYAATLRVSDWRPQAEPPEHRQARRWLDSRRRMLRPTTPEELRATDAFFALLAKWPADEEDAPDVTGVCRSFALADVVQAFGSDGGSATPLRVQQNLVFMIRRLRADKAFDATAVLADALQATGQPAHAARERMLVAAEAGQFDEALRICKSLAEAGEGTLIRPMSDWLFVRLARAPGDVDAIALAIYLLESGHIKPLNSDISGSIASVMLSLAGWAGGAGRDPGEDAPSKDWANEQLDRIEAGLKEARSHGSAAASIDLTYIRLLGIRERYDAAFEAMADYVRRNVVTRGATTIFGQVMDRYLRRRHSAGERMDLVAPLLDDAVFAAYRTRLDQEEEAIWSSWPFAHNLTTAQTAADERRAHVKPAGPMRMDGRTRVLVISSNWNFIPPLIEAIEQKDAGEFVFRSLDFQSLLLADRHARPDGFFFFSEAAARQAWTKVQSACPDAARLVDWADVVFIEWANQPAVFFSNVLPPDKKLVVRLHSYEAFSKWHYFIDWARVDKGLFVADHIRRIFLAQNRLARVSKLSTDIVANRHDFSVQVSPRTAAQKRTLCMLGWATANKDPLFALDVLKSLRAQGQDWRLQLVGSGWRDAASEFEADYRARFDVALADPDIAGAVDILPHTDRPLEVMSSVGYVLSASHREGTHEAVIEGLATGCVPIIRDWPMVADHGGARSQFASFIDYVVSTPEEAAETIRRSPWTPRLAKTLRDRALQAYGTERTVAALENALRLP